MNEKQMNDNMQKMVKYLYPTKQIMDLMCNDIYQELLEFIPLDMCISEDNLNTQIREQNLAFIHGAITGFVLGNYNYKKILFEYYKHTNIEWIVNDIIIGLMFYISNIIEEFNNIDIFNNKQSILYGNTFILDLIV